MRLNDIISGYFYVLVLKVFPLVIVFFHGDGCGLEYKGTLTPSSGRDKYGVDKRLIIGYDNKN